MLFERTALSKKPEQIIRKELSALRQGDQVSPDLVFRDPYLLDFLGLRDTFSEKDLESARRECGVGDEIGNEKFGFR
jgi:predicted nuclease of restriction endonuclease-like (RecB) superfamily